MSNDRCNRCLKGLSRRIPCFVAWTLLLSSTVLYLVFICPSIVKQFSLIVALIQGIILIFVINNFLMATFTDPGRYGRAPADENDDSETTFHKTVEIHGSQCRMKWCQTCGFYRPPRCSHCSVCDFCIDTFDHHCPWLNNCIGRRNYHYFIYFLLSLLVHMFIVLSLSIYYLLKLGKHLGDLPSIISIFLIVIIVLLTVPVGGLTIFHLMLIFRGRTTNEQVTGKFKTNTNPFDYGWMMNVCRLLSSSKYPKLIQPAKKTSKRQKKNLYQIRNQNIDFSNGIHSNAEIKPFSMTSV